MAALSNFSLLKWYEGLNTEESIQYLVDNLPKDKIAKTLAWNAASLARERVKALEASY